MQTVDVIIVGAGAAGLMCAIEAGKRHRKVIVLDHANKVGKKILMSGGGRCNFTNYNIEAQCYISHNPHFCKSALTRYTQWDFINLVKAHGIPYHEKTKGQLFCDRKSQDIVDMLLSLCEKAGVEIYLNTKVESIENPAEYRFNIKSSRGVFQCQSLVIASGGLSIPTMGASPFGYKVAEQFGLKVWPTRAGLVPLTLDSKDKTRLSVLSGISVACTVQNKQHNFQEKLLFTHRGLSGPAILQISSYWNPGEELCINLLPDTSLLESLKLAQQQHPNKQLKAVLSDLLPKRMVEVYLDPKAATEKLCTLSYRILEKITQDFQAWKLKPNGTEGYRTAEVTLGGVDCDALSSKTLETKTVPGLYFIGEVVDVSGWLGGFNFQWAWASGAAAGRVL